MAQKGLTDKDLRRILNIDVKTLKRFQQIQQETIAEVKAMVKRKNKKIMVLGVSGSTRSSFDTVQEDSNSEALLINCLKYCKKIGAETDLIKLREHKIEYCRACYSTANTQCHFYCTCYPKGTPQ